MYIGNFKLIPDILELQIKKVSRADCFNKLSKGGDLKKRVWETLI